MPKKKPISIEVVDQGEGRFVVSTYAGGEIVREAVDATKKPRRQPRRPQQKLKTERMNRTWKKSF
jgi:hypothetical protein